MQERAQRMLQAGNVTYDPARGWPHHVNELKQRMPHADAYLHRRTSKLSWPPAAPPELQPIAEVIWSLPYNAPVTLAGLFRSCTFCELKIYKVVDELVQSKHFDWSCPEFAEEVA